MSNFIKNAINRHHFVLSWHKASFLIKMWINSLTNSVFSCRVSLGVKVTLFFALIALSVPQKSSYVPLSSKNLQVMRVKSAECISRVIQQ